jgi:predicted metal-dependent hydrolase
LVLGLIGFKITKGLVGSKKVDQKKFDKLIMAKAKEQKRRWGSCTSRGDLYFNWRLAMAPPGIIDYIVVHELCHLAHKDHSRKFWDLVGSILPDFKKRKKWLKENGLKLEI